MSYYVHWLGISNGHYPCARGAFANQEISEFQEIRVEDKWKILEVEGLEG